MGSSSSKPTYSWMGFFFGQAMGSSAYTRPLTFSPVRLDLRGRQYVVTGGSSGIGRAAATALFMNGATVHILCRDISRGNQTISEIRQLVEGGQVNSEGSLHAHCVDCGKVSELQDFSGKIFGGEAKLDGLVNNAGALVTRRSLVDGLESHVACHVVGLHALTKFLRPALERASKECPNRVHVVNVASAGLYTAKFDLPAFENGFSEVEESDGSYDGALVYAVCKRAQLELTKLWAQELLESAVTVSCMHPGWAKTDGLGGLFELYPSYQSWYESFRSPEDGADTIVWLLTQEGVASGQFWFDREIASEHQWLAGTSSTTEEQQALWQYCEDEVAKRVSD